MSHTPKTFQAIYIYFTKLKNPPCEFYTHLFFASAIILVFGGLFLHRIYMLIKANTIRIRLPKTYCAKKFRTRRENKNSSNISWKARYKNPKGHTKNRPFFLQNLKV